MRSQTPNDSHRMPAQKSRGIALLVMLAFILVVFTGMAISRLSSSSAEQKSRERTTQALSHAREAIMAAALVPNPPGILPCPDGNGDGLADILFANVCPNRRGLVPYKTLGIDQPLDGTGAPIWYVVAPEYSGTALPPSPPHNSSKLILSTHLRLNTSLVAFVLLAPQIPLVGQNRTSKTPLFGAVAQFLEGENANSSFDNTYTDVISSTQNDVVLAMPVRGFWTAVEGRVLHDVVALLRDYRNLCGVYPWPALYSANNNVSDPAMPIATKTYEGRVPFTSALPFGWGAACPPNTAPAAPSGWLQTHWGDSLYYAICKQAPPANPPAAPNANCLQLGVGTAEAIVMAPGTLNLSQDRFTPPVVIGDYFEGQNASPGDNVFTLTKPIGLTDTFNDLIYVIR